MKMAIFDLDGTLAPPDGPIPDEVVSALRVIEQAGVLVVLCSGKPTCYLAGVARQLGLGEVALIGETGFAIQLGAVVPPRQHHEMPLPPDAPGFLAQLASEIRERVDGRIWFQPNSGSLTVFYYDEQTRDLLDDLLARVVADREDLQLFRSLDCFDVTFGLTKADGISWLLADRGVSADEVVYVGDGENDQAAFDLIPDSIAIDPRHRLAARAHVDDIGAAMRSILDRLSPESEV